MIYSTLGRSAGSSWRPGCLRGFLQELGIPPVEKLPEGDSAALYGKT